MKKRNGNILVNLLILVYAFLIIGCERQDEMQNSKPVIVKRKIIQRETIIIRDTIKIIDSSYVQ